MNAPYLGSPATTTEPPVALSSAPLARLLGETYALHYGNTRTPMVRVVPDDHYPNMWRMLWPDGQLSRDRNCDSDMANLVRIKDAANELCDRGPPRRDRRRFHWRTVAP